jgi:hypothetical protein
MKILAAMWVLTTWIVGWDDTADPEWRHQRVKSQAHCELMARLHLMRPRTIAKGGGDAMCSYIGPGSPADLHELQSNDTDG